MDAQAILKNASELKDKGNEALKAGNLDAAIKHYHYGHLSTKSAIASSAVASMGSAEHSARANETEASEIKALHCALLNNLCLALMKKEKWERVIKVATDILEVDSTSIKAYIRRAKAYVKTNRQLLSEKDVNQGLAIDPAQADLLKMKEYLAACAKASQAKMDQRMKGWIDRM